MVDITFKYKDSYSRGKWNKQSCHVSDLAECIRIYGLDDPDVEYQIISIKECED